MKSYRNIKKFAVLLLVLMTALFSLTACGEDDSYQGQVDGIIKYFKQVVQVGKNDNIAGNASFTAGNSVLDWMMVVSARAGKEDDYASYLTDLQGYVTECYKTPVKLDRIKATEWHRIALAIAACGGDPTAFGTDPKGQPINLIADGIYNWRQSKAIDLQGSNALVHALLTLDCKAYPVPKNAKYNRNKLVLMLLSYQRADGTFSLDKHGEGDLDLTGMALQALAPYYKGDSVSSEISPKAKAMVKAAVNKAIKALSDNETDAAMYVYGTDYSSETISQAILGLAAVGVDPASDERFQRTGGSLADGLMQFKMDDGSFSHVLEDSSGDLGDNELASQQAATAFIALMLLENGNGNFYDFNNTLK